MQTRDIRNSVSERLIEEIQTTEDIRQQKKKERLEKKRQKEARLHSERRQRLVAPLILFVTVILGCLAMLLQTRL